MTNPALFATYLHDTMNARRMSAEEFEHELGTVSKDAVQSWLNGWSSPDLDQLPAVARALRQDPVEVASAWLIDQVPALHAPIYADVLHPRGSRFPPPDDLAVRAPSPRRAGTHERMDVDDPHDAQREPKPAVAERLIRKRPASRPTVDTSGPERG